MNKWKFILKIIRKFLISLLFIYIISYIMYQIFGSQYINERSNTLSNQLKRFSLTNISQHSEPMALFFKA